MMASFNVVDSLRRLSRERRCAFDLLWSRAVAGVEDELLHGLERNDFRSGDALLSQGLR